MTGSAPFRVQVTERNLDYLKLKTHKQFNWTQAEDKMSTNQDAVVIPVIWRGNLVCSNRARQGIMLDAS